MLADSDSEILCAHGRQRWKNAGDMELAGIAEDGAKALAAVGELQPDLLIIDLVLPVMDGITMTMRLREKYEFPVIMLSAKSEEVDKVMGLISAQMIMSQSHLPRWN